MNFVLEAGTISFASADSGNISFTKDHKNAPVVVLMSENTTNQNVNVHATSVTKTGATVKTSAIYTGNIHYQAISTY
tara:strand:+ start:111 stop:341 length:231 start_codon:yes stop_codon:yes gene_type:complete